MSDRSPSGSGSSLPVSMSRIVRVGGVGKAELLDQLGQAGVEVNALGLKLFADPRFVTSATPAIVQVALITVGALGLPDGGTFAEVLAAADLRGLSPCALEVAPHLRLQFTKQAEGFVGAPQSSNQAPPGSLTVASLPVSQDDADPCGFYLRRIDGVLWLRGYRSWPGHRWMAADEFVFACSPLTSKATTHATP